MHVTYKFNCTNKSSPVEAVWAVSFFVKKPRNVQNYWLGRLKFRWPQISFRYAPTFKVVDVVRTFSL